MLQLIAAAALATAAPDFTGDWVMHLYLGKRLFDDRIHVEPGGRSGKLTVPDRFTSPLERVEVTREVVRFEIVGHEHGEAFRVRYEGRWDAEGTVFTGFATLPEEHGELLGGFVAQREEPSKK